MSTTPLHKGIYSLLFASLMSACGTIGIPRNHLRNGSIIVNPNRGFLFQDQYVYENVNQNDLEKRLVEIAATDSLEEAWIYNPRSGVLQEIGFYEDERSVKHLRPFWYPNFVEEGDAIVFYHFHLGINFWGFDDDKEITKKEIVEKINGENSATALPSGKDVGNAIELYQHYKHKKIKVEARIADYEGILTFTLDEQANFDQLPQQANDLQVEYRKFNIGFEEYVARMGELGVSIKYHKIRDIIFQEKDITINKNN